MTLEIHKKLQYLKVLSAEKDDGVFVRKQTASVRLDIHHRFQELGRMTAILQLEVAKQISNHENDTDQKVFYDKFDKKASMYIRHIRKLREQLKHLGLPMDAQE